MSDYIPTVEEIAELRQAVLDAYEAGDSESHVWVSDWARHTFFEDDGGMVDVIAALAATRAAMDRQRRETQEDYVAIAAKQDRDAQARDTLIWMANRYGDMIEKVVALVDADPEDAGMLPAAVDRVVAEHLAMRARIAELEEAATLAAACRPPEIRDRPTDSDLSRLVKALEGTGDGLYVLGSELLESRARIAELENQIQLLEGLDPEHA